MKKILLVALVALALAVSLKVSRSGTPAVFSCGGFDTGTNSTVPMSVLTTGPGGTCTFTTGPYGIVYATGTAEVTCTGTETVQMYYGPGASPVSGANFLGSVSAGVLTVTSLIPGIGNPPWTIQAGQTLTGISMAAVATTTTITVQTNGTQAISSLTWSAGVVTATTSAPYGYLSNGGNFQVSISGATPSGYNGAFTATPTGASTFTYPLVSNPGAETVPGAMTTVGGPGTYTIPNSSISLPGGTNFHTLNPIPGGAINMTPALKQNVCDGGFVATSVAGVFVGAPNTQYWIGIAINSDSNSNGAEWNNVSTAVFTY